MLWSFQSEKQKALEIMRKSLEAVLQFDNVIPRKIEYPMEAGKSEIKQEENGIGLVRYREFNEGSENKILNYVRLPEKKEIYEIIIRFFTHQLPKTSIFCL